MILLLAGSPGSGKGTQADLLVTRNQFEAFSVGEALRHRAQHDELLKQQMDSGGLAPSGIVRDVVHDFLNSHIDGRGIIDGAPRDPEQAAWFQDWVTNHPDVSIAIIELMVPEDEVKERLALRGRDDDDPESLSHRLEIYRTSTRKVIDALAKQFPYYSVDGQGSQEEVYKRIIATGAL